MARKRTSAPAQHINPSVTPVSHARYEARTKRTNQPSVSANPNVTVPVAARINEPRRGQTRRFPLIALVVAVVLAGGIGVFAWASGLFAAQEDTPENIQKNAEANVDYGLPTAQDIAGATPESLAALVEAGGTAVYDNASEDEKNAGKADLFHLPEGLSLTTAGAWYLQGIDKISATDAARFLNGSWRVTLASGAAYDCRVRYAVFDADSQSAAVEQALSAFGLDAKGAALQTDSYGNTYTEGTLSKDGTEYTWRVAACPLRDVYDNEGLPATASYVVLTMKA